MTEDEMGQAVGNMFPIIVAARLLSGLVPGAHTFRGDLTRAIWEAWLQMEAMTEETIQEYRSGLLWLPPKLQACSLYSRLNGSAAGGGGQVQSWMTTAPSVALGIQLALWHVSQSPSMLSLTNGNSGLGIFAGNFDASTLQWKNLVHYKVLPDTAWHSLLNAAEAAIKRILRKAETQRSVVLLVAKELQDARVLCSTAGAPGFAVQRLASLLVAARMELHVTWASHPSYRAAVVVQAFRSALVDMKKRMEGVGQAAFEARFREVLAACMAEHQLQPRAMGLRFCVLLSSLWLPRPLATPPFLAEGQGLDAGLCAWRRLGEARGAVLRRGSVLQVQSPEEIAATWSRVRSAYLDAVAASSAGGDKRKGIEAAARLQVLEAAQAGQRERQLERWNRRRMAQEEAMQRRNRRPGANEILKRVDQLLQMWSRHSMPEM
eukprot:s1644_g16.t1